MDKMWPLDLASEFGEAGEDTAVPNIAANLDAQTADQVGRNPELGGEIRTKLGMNCFGDRLSGGLGQWNGTDDCGMTPCQFEPDESGEFFEGRKISPGLRLGEPGDDLRNPRGIELAVFRGKSEKVSCEFAGFATDLHEAS